jgi:hypothetical protein
MVKGAPLLFYVRVLHLIWLQLGGIVVFSYMKIPHTKTLSWDLRLRKFYQKRKHKTGAQDPATKVPMIPV